MVSDSGVDTKCPVLYEAQEEVTVSDRGVDTK